MKRRPVLFVFADGHTARSEVMDPPPERYSLAIAGPRGPGRIMDEPPAPPTGRVVRFELVREVDNGTTFVHYREMVPRSRKAVGFVYKDGTTEVREVPWPPDLRHTVKRKRLQTVTDRGATTLAMAPIVEESLAFHLTEMGGTVHYRQDP